MQDWNPEPYWIGQHAIRLSLFLFRVNAMFLSQ